MRVLISGSTGLIGSRLMSELATQGNEVVRLARPETRAGGEKVVWSPETGRIERGSLEGFDVMVHLAGDNIAAGRWTEAKKRRIRESRLVGTARLAEAVARLSAPPKVVVSASAVGFYGDRGDTPLDETAPPGAGFLADVCREWEAAAMAAAASGARVVTVRTGVVLEGLLGKMKLPFSLGLGGRLGDGRQYMSWIGLDDICGAIRHAMATASLDGPVNGVAPAPATNAQFTEALGRALRRPTPLPVPRPAARALFGEMADALLFASARVVPAKLQASGYKFRHPDIDSGLRAALGK